MGLIELLFLEKKIYKISTGYFFVKFYSFWFVILGSGYVLNILFSGYLVAVNVSIGTGKIYTHAKNDVIKNRFMLLFRCGV